MSLVTFITEGGGGGGGGGGMYDPIDLPRPGIRGGGKVPWEEAKEGKDEGILQSICLVHLLIKFSLIYSLWHHAW